MPSDKDGKDAQKALDAAFGDCPTLKKYTHVYKSKDGSLKMDIKPKQIKAVCAEFESTSSKCRTHAVVGKFLGGLCKDFCDQAPTQLVNLCKAEKQKCMTSSKEAAKQKACWDAKMKQLMAMANGGSGPCACMQTPWSQTSGVTFI